MAFDPTFLFQVAAILFVAKVFGEIAERLRMSPIVGEIAAGLLLGPLLHVIAPSDFLGQMANFGILFIAFLIGIHIKFGESRKDILEGTIITLSISAVSFIAGLAAGIYFFSFESGLFIGAAMMVSSASIGIKSLMDVGEIKSKAHDIIITANKINDVTATIAVSLVSAYIIFGMKNFVGIAGVFIAVIAIAACLIAFGSKYIGNALSSLGRLKDEQIMLSIPLSAIFIIAFLSDKFGIAGVAGAFLVGLAMSRSSITESSVVPKMKILSYGFFAPLFFAYSAVLLDIPVILSAMTAAAATAILLIIAAFAGSAFFGRRYRFSGKDGMIIGASKIPRGEFSVIIAQIAFGAAVITGSVYSVIILSVLATAVLAPVILRVLYRRQ